MNHRKPSSRRGWWPLCFLFFFLFSPDAFGRKADYYYNIGLGLYHSKKYQKAIPWFTHPLKLKPYHIPSLMGRANCYYALGQYPQALEDYETMEFVKADPRLEQMIRILQSKTGAAPLPQGAPPPGREPEEWAPARKAASRAMARRAPPPAASPRARVSSAPLAARPLDSLHQGAVYLNRKLYAQAVPWFQRAIQENPNDARVYYYLALCQLQLGDLQDALESLELYEQRRPSRQVENYIARLRARVSPAPVPAPQPQPVPETTLVYNSPMAPAAQPPSAPMTVLVLSGPIQPLSPPAFGIRMEPVLSMVNLSYFTAAAKGGLILAQQQQATDPTMSFNGSVPTGYSEYGMEIDLKLNPQFEVGLPFAVLPIGNVSLASQDGFGNMVSSGYSLNGFKIGPAVRLFSGKKPFQFFLAAEPFVCPINIKYNAETVQSGVTVTQAGSFSGMALGGLLQAGLDVSIGDHFKITPVVGYQVAAANSFTGSLTTANGSNGEAGQLEFSSIGQGIYFLANGQTPASGDTPVQVDLSGFQAGLFLSGFF
jgi:tetratricopeptide (TPR) repeat protein